MRRFRFRPRFRRRLRRLPRRAPRARPPMSTPPCAEILERVRREGLAAVLRLRPRGSTGSSSTESTIRVTADEIDDGAAACAAEVREAIAFAAAPHPRLSRAPAPGRRTTSPTRPGVELGWRWTPLEAVGIYVPGGRAAYPSTVLMNAVPAAVAGVDRIAMVTPPGRLEPAVLAAAQEAGVTEIWRIGGAQAVAALAYGAGPDPAGRQDRRPRQRLCHRRQAPALRRGRHRRPGRPVRDRRGRRRRQRSGLDRRRPAVPGRARPGRPVDPDHRRRGLRRRRSRPRSSASCSTLATGEDAARLLARPRRGDHRPAGRQRRPWSTGIAPEHVEFAVDDPERAGRPGAARRRDLPRPLHAGGRSATMWPAPTTCCRPAARRGSPRACRSTTSSSAPRSCSCDAGRLRRAGPAHRGPGRGRGPARPRPLGGDPADRS